MIKTLLECRKPVTWAVYAKVRKRFSSWLQGLKHPGIPAVLDFLKADVELGLSISTLKVQAPALSVCFPSDLTSAESIR